MHCFHPVRPTNHIIIAAILGGCSTSSTVAILPLLGAWLYWLHAGWYRQLWRHPLFHYWGRGSTGFMQGLTLSLFGRLPCCGFARPLIVSDFDTLPLHPAGKCCWVYRFHPARPTHLIIIAAISGGCSTSSTVAIMPLLGRCSTGSSGLALSLLPFGRWLYWGFARLADCVRL